MTNLSFKGWVKILKDRESEFEAEDLHRGFKSPVIYKVDPSLRGLKSEPFDASVVSLGIFYIRTGNQSNLPGDTLKVDVVIKFLADIGNVPERWEDISTTVVPNPAEVKRLYDGHWHLDLLEESIQSILALDAIFLTCFLLYFLRKFPPYAQNPLTKPATNGIFSRQHRRINLKIFKDVFKLENQIPLELLRNVIGIVFQSHHGHWTKESCLNCANEMLETICFQCVQTLRKRLPSFQLAKAPWPAVDHPALPIKLHECQHLLHCLAEAFWNGAKAPPNPDIPQANRRTTFILTGYEALMRQLRTVCSFGKCTLRNHKYHQLGARKHQYLPTANKLHKYGIKFQGQEGFHPKFEKHPYFYWKATLFLPTIAVIDDGTNEQWRNLLAFEDAYAGPAKERSFMSYLRFMDELVNNEDDVSVLCTGKRPVIQWNGLGDDKAVADLFNSVTENHIATHSKEWSLIKQELVDYHNASFRKLWFEFVENYVNKPWLLLSALVILVLTLLQTIYANHS